MIAKLVTFFLLTYAVMWALFFTVAYAVPATTPLGYTMLLLGSYAPGIIAVALTARDAGAAGLRELVGPVLRWQVHVRWYVFAATYIVGVKLAAALVHRALLGEWPRFGTDPLWLIPLAIAFSTPFQAGEEIGWRGYALPRLADRMGLRWAGIVLGVIWALWHIPQFFITTSDTYGQSFAFYAAQVVALSVAMTWLWARTGASLLLVMLLHAAVNNSKDIVPSGQPGSTNMWGFNANPVALITVAILWICAIGFLVTMPAAGRVRPRT
ncbi:MAG TPA: CPBP family intramembrane glutamic endopeptidase [Gemmatimonadaceae bacterium]|nr:CPBP family intramembrane glutamic endopeptidase [Gemmatimonadaceae bacterium]